MRNKIDYGIDLGTTNSAIARMENGKPIIKKSDTLKDTTPSCVHINKRKDFLVGDTAFNVMKTDNARALKDFKKDKVNSYIEFKRMMGTTQTFESSNITSTLTSEDLSSEVLKKLKSYILDENVNSVVITVPAKFLTQQKEATVKAAQLAGFKHVELLQEPVAAATAYGLSASKKDGYWMVFDFGGGTFDAALVKSEESILSVKDTAGDNWLGGKNLDNALVDEIIIPYLKNNYAIDFVVNDEVKLQILRDAVKPFAEEAKNQLSFKDEHNILSNLGDLPFEDENGDEPEIDIKVTQKDMERVLGPIFQKAIDITKELLKNNNLKGSDLDALILVGGPTYSPILRRMLKEQITDKVDTTIDPMTAVASGAALFASTISVSEAVKEASRDKTKLQIDLQYDSATVDMESMVSIALLKDKTEGSIPEKVFVELFRHDGAWSSGKQLIGDRKSLFELILIEGSNQFEVKAYNEQGDFIECQPIQFNILQGIGGLDSMTVLPYNIGIAKYYDAEDKDLFASVSGLEKNKKVPATGIRSGLKTMSNIRPGNREDIIKIPIYQGEHNADGTNPILNNWVYDVIITGESIPKLLPLGSEVEITIKVDRSEKMKFSAYFPLIDHTEELEIDIKNPEPPTSNFVKGELLKAIKTASIVKDHEIENRLQLMVEDLSKEGGSPDGCMKILDGLRKELIILEEKEKGLLWPEVEKALKDSFYQLEDLINKIKTAGHDENLNMDTVNSHFNEYRKNVDHIIREKLIKEAKELMQDINSMDFNIRNAVTGNAMDVQFLNHFNDSFSNINWTNPSKARQLINQGIQMANAGQTSGIRNILIDLIELMPVDQRPVGLR